ncbi:uncharacterized protein LOC102702664 [Oryza brachyantha]|uniref:Uncharacterized protein n=1 Tax=Oryza brachyantha TaxID=4533 RepID=J3MB88_ORYBR|nr:uncharacterized protein LOC102702664 [Oryza brachyantha]
MERHSALTKIGFCVLLANSALAIYSSRGHAGSVAFVLAADAALALLFVALAKYERAAEEGDAAAGGKIKGAVWALSTLLTAMFASRVAPLMPPFAAAAVWLMSAATAIAGFWAFFLSNP